MDLFWLACLQSITEFLPVSSSAHLDVLSRLLALPAPTRPLEVTLNLMTTLVIVIYFRVNIHEMTIGFFTLFRRKITRDAHSFFRLCWATLPVVAAGYFVHTYDWFLANTFKMIGWVAIGFGVCLILVDWAGSLRKTYKSMGYGDAFFIGLGQVVALVPGASRLGCTLIMARLLGYKRTDAARFSFLLAIPTSIAATTLLAKKIWESSTLFFSFDALVVIIPTFIIGYVTLHLFMAGLKAHTLLIWGLYRIAFGVFILWYFT